MIPNPKVVYLPPNPVLSRVLCESIFVKSSKENVRIHTRRRLHSPGGTTYSIRGKHVEWLQDTGRSRVNVYMVKVGCHYDDSDGLDTCP